jgi:hypothetical protein
MNDLVTMQLQVANQYRQVGRLRQAEDDSKPIFITGLPHSGTMTID